MRIKKKSSLFPNKVLQIESCVTFTHYVSNMEKLFVHSISTILYKYQIQTDDIVCAVEKYISLHTFLLLHCSTKFQVSNEKPNNIK